MTYAELKATGCITSHVTADKAIHWSQPGSEDSWYCRPLTRAECPTCFASPEQEAIFKLQDELGGLPIWDYRGIGGTLNVGCAGKTRAEGYYPGIDGCHYYPPDEDVSFGSFLAGAAIDFASFYVNPIGFMAQKASQAAASSVQHAVTATGGDPMSLDLGGIFGGVANVLGGLSTGNYLGALSGAANIASSALYNPPSYPTQIAYSPMPSYPAPQQPVYQAQPVSAPIFVAAAGAIARLTAPILAKIAVKLGHRARPSLTRAMDLIRKAQKILISPEAVAVALGITIGELSTLITSHNSRKSRRMNPANAKALRRASRRIKSFHKLCTHTDVLKNRGRKTSFKSCGTCKRSPCRC